MLRLNDEAIAQIDPSATIKEIKQIGKAQTEEAAPDDSEEEEAAEDEKKEKKEKKNVRDTNIPVMRLLMASGLTWDSTVSDKVKKMCEHYLTDERRELDGKQYKLEINIVYPDESAM